MKPDGLLGMIIPNTWLVLLQGDRIRQHLLTHTQIEGITHYRRPVFSKVTVDTEVVLLRNSPPHSRHQVAITIDEKDGKTTRYAIPQARWIAAKERPVNIFERPEFMALADKLRALPRLGDLCTITLGTKPFQVGKGTPPQTEDIARDKPYVADTQRDSTFRPLLRGSLIQRYAILWNNDYWISLGDWLAEPRYAANYDAPEKIVIRQTGDSLIAALDRRQFVVRNNLWTIVVGHADKLDLRYILALLNSRLLTWFYQNVLNPEQGEALAEVKRGHLAQLPVALPAASSQQNSNVMHQVADLVEQLLALHEQSRRPLSQHERTILERQIAQTTGNVDRLVYAIYGLTEDEVRMVESSGQS